MPLSEWIKVSEELPVPFQAVLVSGGIALYTGSVWNTITGYEWPGQAIAWEVKYWMPIPESPKD